MSQNFQITKTSQIKKTDNEKEFVTVKIGEQFFGISVYSVRDILAPQKITHIPLAPIEVVGSLNLRGRIVTAIDISIILEIESKVDRSKSMSIVVDHLGELYSFIVDSIGEVLTLSIDDFAHNPENLPKIWKDVSMGIYPLDRQLLIILDVEKLLGSISNNI